MSNKHIIGLAGTLYSGRSEILETLKKLLIEDGYKDTLQMMYEKEKVKIGVAFRGNYIREVHESLRIFLTFKCNFIITPCLTWGQTHDAISEVPGYTKEYIYILYRGHSMNESNLIYAKEIVEKINDFKKSLY